MSDMSRLLFNEINETLDRLSRNGIGFVDCATADCIEYKIDGRVFEIRITEKQQLNHSLGERNGR